MNFLKYFFRITKFRISNTNSRFAGESKLSYECSVSISSFQKLFFDKVWIIEFQAYYMVGYVSLFIYGEKQLVKV